MKHEACECLSPSHGSLRVVSQRASAARTRFVSRRALPGAIVLDSGRFRLASILSVKYTVTCVKHLEPGLVRDVLPRCNDIATFCLLRHEVGMRAFSQLLYQPFLFPPPWPLSAGKRGRRAASCLMPDMAAIERAASGESAVEHVGANGRHRLGARRGSLLEVVDKAVGLARDEV